MTRSRPSHLVAAASRAGRCRTKRAGLVQSLFRLAAAFCCAGPLSAVNIAPEGTGILGVNDAIDGDAGIAQFNAGVAANINDENLLTSVDTWSGVLHNDKPVSFVGVVWPSKRYEPITDLSLTLATFVDGGWFGVPGSGPGAGGLLTPAYLAEPSVQVTTDGGVTWTGVSHTSDYLAVMDGHGIGGGANPNPSSVTAVFTLDASATKITGIRIIGTNGGFAGADTNGFLGVFELEIEAGPFTDTDWDSMPDAWEQENGLAVGVNDASGDADSDGLINQEEYTLGTNPQSADTDGDGLSDADEQMMYWTDPLVPDTDGDGLSDGEEINVYGTDPTLPDTDNDGLLDGLEVLTYHTDPFSQDTDFDGFSDALEVREGSDPTNPNNYPDNLALLGTGILGTKTDLGAGVETPLFHVGTAANINDGDPATRVDTWNEAGTDPVSFVGIVWAQPVPNQIVTLELTLATFSDGGWFGVNGIGPGAGRALSARFLVEPTIQVSSDPTSSVWTEAGHTSDYLTALTGHRIGGGAMPNPSSVTATFTLDSPATNITGIRILGTEGGTASGGFLGVFELAVRTLVSDSDNDGMNDAWERLNGLVVGTDDASDDPDADGLPNLGEFEAGSDPHVPDTDGDGLDDGAEVLQHQTSPTRADTDGDQLDDRAEIETYLTNPNAPDTDGDGFGDATELERGTDPRDPAVFPSNLALIGTAIMGVRDTVESGTEIPYSQAGVPAYINDGDLTTRVDTWNGAGVTTASYVGILWDHLLTQPIGRLDVSLAIFFDGGWFGVNGSGPGAGGYLSAPAHLVEPTVQVTSDGGLNWSPVAHTSDYLTALDGQPLPAVPFGPPTAGMAAFVLDVPQAGINGIRLIGTEGGTASGGFLGVFELETHTVGAGPIAVELLNVGYVGGQFRFEFDSQAGATHTVQFKTALTDAVWQTLTTIAGDGTRKPVADAASDLQRFYRVLTE